MNNRLFLLIIIVLFFGLVILVSSYGPEIMESSIQKDYDSTTQGFGFLTGQEESRAATHKRKSYYVPVYSHLYVGAGTPLPMSTTLSIRNMDPKMTVLIKAVGLFNTQGKLIRHYLSNPEPLKALATKEFFIDESDLAAGSGANFLVEIEGSDQVLVESLTLGGTGNRGYSIVSRSPQNQCP